MYLYVVVQLPCLHAAVPLGCNAASLRFIHVAVLACEELTRVSMFWFQMIWRIKQKTSLCYCHLSKPIFLWLADVAFLTLFWPQHGRSDSYRIFHYLLYDHLLPWDNFSLRPMNFSWLHLCFFILCYMFPDTAWYFKQYMSPLRRLCLVS
jgi:hypothetical protein